MITISLCMIVKNEKMTLGRCLESVKDIVDEIIIVDTGSDDNTKEIAEKYTPHVYDFQWVDDFSAARNFAFSKANMEYWMWLDADDVLLEEDRNKLLELKKEIQNKVDIVMCKYNLSLDNNGNPTFTYYRERIIRRTPVMPWKGFIHEAVTPYGNIIYSDAAITHRQEGNRDGKRNLLIYEKHRQQGTEFTARDLYYYGRELYYNKKYDKAIKTLEEFLITQGSWVENLIEACQILSYCFYASDEENKALQILFRSFQYDVPRAEICCDIGKHFFDRNKFIQAIYWYEKAASCDKNKDALGFTVPDCYDFTPYLQLCLCHYSIGNLQEAQKYNEVAGTYKPDSSAYKYNKTFFSSIK